MKSRDGFEEVNRELREGAWLEDAVSRRAMLKALGLTAAGVAAGLAPTMPSLAHAQAAKRGGQIKIGIFQNIDTLTPAACGSGTACTTPPVVLPFMRPRSVSIAEPMGPLCSLSARSCGAVMLGFRVRTWMLYLRARFCRSLIWS